MFKQLLFLLAIGLSQGLYAQKCSYELFGEVYDIHENIPLERVRVTVVETNQQLSTNAKGKFLFRNLCKGQYTLLFEHPDCISITQNQSLPVASVKRYYLEHHINELEEIIVSEISHKNTTKTGIERRLTEREIKRFRAQNLGDALAQLSGVSSIKTGNAIVKPMVHGVTGSRLAIVNDGIRLQDHEWGADHAPSIDVNGADQVQLIKGATALKYGGDVLGGVLEITPKTYRLKDSLIGVLTAGYATQGQGGYLLTNLTKTYASGSFLGGVTSLKNAGDFQHPDYALSNTGNKEQHAQLYFGRNKITQKWRIDYRFYQKEAGILSSAHVGTVGDIARALESDQPLSTLPWTRKIKNPRQQTTHHNLSFRYDQRLENQAKWDLLYTYQSNNRKEFDIRRGEFNDRAALDILLQSHDLVTNYQSKEKNDFQWSTGFSLQLQDNFSDPSTGVRRLIPDYLRYKFGLYWINQYFPSNDFTAELGFRFDYDYLDAQKFYKIDVWNDRGYDQDFASTIVSTGNAGNYLTRQLKKFANFSASAGVKQKLGEEMVRFNLGYITRAPNPAELFSDGLHHALATIELGDLRLTQERGLKALFSIEKQSGAFTYALTGHYSSIADYIVLQPGEAGFDQARNSAFLVREYVQLPRVNTQGIDLDLSYQILPQLQYKTTAAWVSIKTKGGTPLIDVPPLNIYQEIQFKLKKDNPLRLLLGSQYVAQQNQVPDFNFEYNFFEDGNISSRIVDISTAPKAYHLIKLSIETKVFDKIDISLSADNIFNVDYRNYLNRLRYFAGETGRNIRLELSYLF